MPSPALIVSLPGHKFSNKLAANAPNNLLKNQPLCLLSHFLSVSLTSFINKPDSSCDLTFFMISFISSFKIINVVCFATSKEHAPNLKMFLSIAASVTDATTVNPNGTKILLAKIHIDTFR